MTQWPHRCNQTRSVLTTRRWWQNLFPFSFKKRACGTNWALAVRNIAAHGRCLPGTASSSQSVKPLERHYGCKIREDCRCHHELGHRRQPRRCLGARLWRALSYPSGVPRWPMAVHVEREACLVDRARRAGEDGSAF